MGRHKERGSDEGLKGYCGAVRGEEGKLSKEWRVFWGVVGKRRGRRPKGERERGRRELINKGGIVMDLK